MFAAGIFLVSYAVFSLYGILGFPDYWGDSYHNLYMSWLTSENHWVYTDYKGRHLAWLPLHTYLSGSWMQLFDSFTLRTVHVENRLVGALTVVGVYLLASKLLNRKAGIHSAMILSLTPFWILYSNLNMSEALTGFLIVMVIVFTTYEKPVWVFVFTFFGFFTRYEFTPLIGLFGLYLFMQNPRNKYFWIMLTAGTLAICSWSWWSYNNTGNIFDWLQQKGSSLYDAKFHESDKTFYGPFLSWWIALPVLPVLLWGLVKLNYRKLWSESSLLLSLIGVMVFHWLAIFIGQIWFTSYPDPKYFIITIPVTSIVVAYLTQEVLPIRIRRLGCLLIFLGLFQLPFYYFLQFTIDPQLEMGRYLKMYHNSYDSQNIWIDFPVAQIESNLAFGHFYTSEMLLPMEVRGAEGAQNILKGNLVENEVSYVVTYHSSFSRATDYLPFRDATSSFKALGYQWTPIYCYRYQEVKEDGIVGLVQYVRSKIQSGQPPICLWKIESG